MKCYLHQVWHKGGLHYNKQDNGSCYFKWHWHKRAVTIKRMAIATIINTTTIELLQQKMSSDGYYFKQQWHSRATSKQTLTITVATSSNSDTTVTQQSYIKIKQITITVPLKAMVTQGSYIITIEPQWQWLLLKVTAAQESCICTK